MNNPNSRNGLAEIAPATGLPAQADEELANLAKAVAHPIRVAILRHLIRHGECICGDLVELLPLAQSTVSQHLKVLKESGLLQGEVDGPRVCYCADPAVVARLRKLVHELDRDKEPTMSDTTMPTTDPDGIRAVVREKYGAIASGGSSCCEPAGGCCGPEQPDAVLHQIGYTREQSAAIPEGANLGLGCGNPLAYAEVRPGETVLDLGSGAGIDAFLAAREVGPSGRVLGVDMTAAMIEKARSAATRNGITNVEFRLGEIEHLPIADASVDVVISNCVINLSPDKPQVFREALRVLRPGGRLLVSDLVLTQPLPAAVRESVTAYVGCVAGASLREEYVAMMLAAGFRGVEIVAENPYTVADETSSPEYRDGLQAVVSAKVRARKG